MGYVTIRIRSEQLGELMKITSEGKTHAQQCSYRCPSCQHPLEVQINIRENQNMIIFKENVEHDMEHHQQHGVTDQDDAAATGQKIHQRNSGGSNFKKPNISVRSLDSRNEQVIGEASGSSTFHENDWVDTEEYDGTVATSGAGDEMGEEEYNPFDDESPSIAGIVATKLEELSNDERIVIHQESNARITKAAAAPKIQQQGPTEKKRRQRNMMKRAKPWECSHCHKTYSEKRVFNRHVKDSPDCSKAEALAHCWFCTDVFSETKRFTDHLSSVHDYRKTTARCIRCGEIFTSDNEKREHMLLQHFEKTGKRFQCRYCPKVFVRKFTVQQHEKVSNLEFLMELVPNFEKKV